jgi:hypothetical protein
MLTDEQLAEFETDGWVKLAGAFSIDEARSMQTALWGELGHKYGMRPDEPATWTTITPTGLKNTKRNRRFDAILGAPLREALDQLLGVERWRPPKQWGNVLVNMPEPGSWRVPHRLWHSDFGYDDHFRLDPPFAVKVWALFDDVEPGGAGTPQLLGSHRVVEGWLRRHRTETRDYSAVRNKIMRSDPWLQSLGTDDGDPGRNERFMVDGGVVEGVPVRVAECTGAAGDVYVTHGWVFHTLATNHATRPRMMRSAGFYRI